MLTVRPLWGLLWGGGVACVNQLLYCSFVSIHKRSSTKIMRLVWRSWTHSEEDRKLAPLWGPYFAHLEWLVETVLKNKILSCCPKGHGFVQLCWDSCLSEREDITWMAGCRQILASVNFWAILIYIPPTADVFLELLGYTLPVKVKLHFYFERLLWVELKWRPKQSRDERMMRAVKMNQSFKSDGR